MSNKPITEDEFDIKIQGNILSIMHEGKVLSTLNLKESASLARRFKDNRVKDTPVLDDDLESESNEPLIHKSDVREFVEIYKGLVYKYTRVKKNYKETGKYWQHFIKGAKTAVRMEISAVEYINALFAGYSQFNRDSTVEIPWPAQLHGESAEQFVVKHLGKHSQVALEGEISRKLAHANKNIPLAEDNKYQKIKDDIRKKKPYTFDDLEYCSVRQIQCEGFEAPWVSNYRECLRSGKEAVEK